MVNEQWNNGTMIMNIVVVDDDAIYLRKTQIFCSINWIFGWLTGLVNIVHLWLLHQEYIYYIYIYRYIENKFISRKSVREKRYRDKEGEGQREKNKKEANFQQNRFFFL